ncbi:MAG: MBL fold metallo-hydrolase [Acidobacteria bacterium]|nr:MBL fold metallo-hydrolase [Acidobacteriota bacterium]
MRILTFGVVLVSVVAVSAADRYPAASGGDILITPILHSSVQLEHAGVVIQVDPWSAGDLAAARPADLILITDTPAHHLDVAAIKRLRKPGAPVVIPASAKTQVPDGIVLANGRSRTFGGVRIDSIAAYDLTPGAPEHPKGEANGYLVSLGGRRIYFAGVTQCVPELTALRDIDVAFMPMNIPPNRMSPAEAADCVKALRPKAVYTYHYDQDYVALLGNPQATLRGIPGGLTVAESLQAFRDALRGQPIEVRSANWYPERRAR